MLWATGGGARWAPAEVEARVKVFRGCAVERGRCCVRGLSETLDYKSEECMSQNYLLISLLLWWWYKQVFYFFYLTRGCLQFTVHKQVKKAKVAP